MNLEEVIPNPGHGMALATVVADVDVGGSIANRSKDGLLRVPEVHFAAPVALNILLRFFLKSEELEVTFLLRIIAKLRRQASVPAQKASPRLAHCLRAFARPLNVSQSIMIDLQGRRE